MTRYLLDTNIVSDVTKPEPSPALLAWMADQDDESLYVSALTIAEIRRGILQLPEGRRRQALAAWFDGPEGPEALFAGRIVPFDQKAAPIWARIMADGTISGRPRSALDMIIAASAEAAGCVLVTNNLKHFEGFPVIDPTRPTGDG